MNETNSNSNQRTSLSLCITISLVMSLRYYFYNQSESLSSIHISRKPVSVPLEASELYLYYTFIAILVPLGGIFAGLTIGLMSLDTTNLAIIKTSGTPLQKRHASTIAPLMKNQHLLLVTLLLSNTIINESLPVLFHSIQLDGIQAVLMSTGLILLFGEIIPQAVCARHGLAVGAFFAWPVRIM